MPLLTFLGVLVLVAVLLGLLNKFGPSFHMDATILRIINAVVLIAVILWILALFLPIGNLNAVRVGPPG